MYTIIKTNGTSHDKDDFSLIALLPNGKVSARNLYKFLELNPSQISRWFKTNILKNGFAIKDKDYLEVDMMSSNNKIKEFYLSVSFAKELCMLARNQKGKDARMYFIAMEEKAKNLSSPSYMIDDRIARAKAWIVEEEQRIQLDKEKQTLQAALEHKQSIILNITEQVPAKTMRNTINEVVRVYAAESIIPFPVVWNKLYKEFKYIYKIDLKTRAVNQQSKPIDVAEQLGRLEDLYNLSLKLFEI